jgi:hypothetical protein
MFNVSLNTKDYLELKWTGIAPVPAKKHPLESIEKGLNSHLFVLMQVLLFLLLFFSVFLVIPGAVVLILVILESVFRLSDNSLIIIASPLVVIGLIAIFSSFKFVIAVMSAVNGYCNKIVLQTAAQQLQLSFYSLLPWRRRNLTIPFNRIDQLNFELGAEGKKPLVISCLIDFQNAEGNSTNLQIPINVNNLRERADALKIVFDIARLLGWSGYQVTKNDPRMMTLELIAQPASSSKFSSLPLPAEINEIGQKITDQSYQQLVNVARFDPAQLKGSTKFEIGEWQPGVRVRILSPAVTGLTSDRILFPMLALMFGLPISILLLSRISLLGVPFFLLTICGAAALFLKFELEREVSIDWSTKQLNFRSKNLLGNKIQCYSFQQVERVILEGFSMYMANKTTPSYTFYWCRLNVEIAGRELKLLELLRFIDDRDRPYQLLMPMAVELAKALGVEWQWKDYPN